MAMNDTTSEISNIQAQLYRNMPIEKKFSLICDCYETGKQIAMAGISDRHPNATDKQIWHLWAKQHLGDELYIKVYGNPANE